MEPQARKMGKTEQAHPNILLDGSGGLSLLETAANEH